MSAVAKFQSRYKNETADLTLTGWNAFIDDDAPDWVQALRRRGHEKLLEKGLPTPKLERWKYTNLPSALKKMDLQHGGLGFTLSGNTDIAEDLSSALKDAPDWLQSMLTGLPVGEDQYGDVMLCDAANAFLRDGIVVDVPAHSAQDDVLTIDVSNQKGVSSAGRFIVRAGDGSTATIIETHQGESASWHNILTQIHIGKNAKLRHYRIQANGDQAVYTQNTHVRIEEGGQYEAFVLTTGAGLSRNQVHAELLGPNADCTLNGINLLSGKQQGDTTITIDHKAPHCTSNQFYRTVLTDEAYGVFQGKVHVHQIAQKTDGYQLSNTLMLSPLAKMDTKPELEIYADDVKCSHGATSGMLDEDPLFYMQARGIPKDQARQLLIQAFLGEVIEQASDDQMQERLQDIVAEWLNEHARD